MLVKKVKSFYYFTKLILSYSQLHDMSLHSRADNNLNEK